MAFHSIEQAERERYVHRDGLVQQQLWPNLQNNVIASAWKYR